LSTGTGMPRRKFLECGLAMAATTAVSGPLARSEEKNKSAAVQSRSKPLFRFAAAQAPRAESLFPSDRWLKAVSQAGYTHLFLQVDPFYHQEADLSTDDEDAIWLLLLFNMTAGPMARSYQAWLGAVSEVVSRHGLKLGMELWEP